ncbi:hypothetical protein CDAR_110301 [Caerostris darwini]|uniref:Uncharacterized protein n=1 Tax=Caerostris darwini TaxID=1538125 RepID=A0AAV4UAW9_9ARAC|nr:hypothetical protein CDAR_110301 [Caerostris darwini]
MSQFRADPSTQDFPRQKIDSSYLEAHPLPLQVPSELDKRATLHSHPLLSHYRLPIPSPLRPKLFCKSLCSMPNAHLKGFANWCALHFGGKTKTTPKSSPTTCCFRFTFGLWRSGRVVVGGGSLAGIQSGPSLHN